MPAVSVDKETTAEKDGQYSVVSKVCNNTGSPKTVVIASNPYLVDKPGFFPKAFEEFLESDPITIPANGCIEFVTPVGPVPPSSTYTDVYDEDGEFLDGVTNNQEWFGILPLFFCGRAVMFLFHAPFTQRIYNEFGSDFSGSFYLESVTGGDPDWLIQVLYPELGVPFRPSALDRGHMGAMRIELGPVVPPEGTQYTLTTDQRVSGAPDEILYQYRTNTQLGVDTTEPQILSESVIPNPADKTIAVTLTADDQVSGVGGGVVEYSTDQGLTWAKGNLDLPPSEVFLATPTLSKEIGPFCTGQQVQVKSTVRDRAGNAAETQLHIIVIP